MRSKKKPALTLHKATGQARVRINGTDHYLGKYGTRESREKYNDLIREWQAENNPSARSICIDELCQLFEDHAADYYRKDGQQTSEVGLIKYALATLKELHAKTPIVDFSPLKLKTVRDAMIVKKWTRKTINSHVARIQRMFVWAVENELCPVDVANSLTMVKTLKRDRCDAKENTPVLPVDDATVKKTLKELSPALQAMVRLQLLTGMRPGELCQLQPRLIDRSGKVWTYRPDSHKTQHHEKQRIIYIGPKAQKVLKPFLQRDADTHCFDPRDVAPERAVQTMYNPDSYRKAVQRACKRAKVESWSPNQLRHAAATKIRAAEDLEAAMAVLGHSDPRITEVYAERDQKRAAKLMEVMG